MHRICWQSHLYHRWCIWNWSRYVQLLYSRGASLAISDINPGVAEIVSKALEKVESRGTQRCTANVVDVGRSSAVESWIDEAVREFGKLDGCANITGKGERLCPLGEKTDEDFNQAIDNNLRGAFNCLRAALKHLSNGASVVNVRSSSGLNATPGLSLYSAAKSGIIGMTKAAAQEYGSKGIRINAIAPGLVLTPGMLAAPGDFILPSIQKTPFQRGADPAELAKAISYFLVTSPHFRPDLSWSLTVDFWLDRKVSDRTVA
ncbi:3-oxoacyl-[acyl-carrier-protein] reductase FabG [Rhinocladiella mackenziei CBS 650.93]|uniref:3-oxoacyl-[acyl-carrier-protein] reductase FabG n=1 Tax=Rhinocladiella mackenziei CBS 650.93 TaxID=1442369 RepID=A0A0D2H5D7_9EURO|nr:3-oxoacyl-[acyl-carrier-protein] reductase FabG [Rhinocladiella mackenziei CBS 650.93]KIX05623.1 3-oxoacyl-[acyl-carrier-protein] reductase FabG [Rhinocladiella mackenziei CBS 650.93]